MAPFLLFHPALLHCWIEARETALARVRALTRSTQTTRRQFRQVLARMGLGLDSWSTADQRQSDRVEELKGDLGKIRDRIEIRCLEQGLPWDDLIHWSETELSLEGQELLVTLVLEPHGELVDNLAQGMAIDESLYFRIRGSRPISELIRLIDTHYQWALEIDYSEQQNCARFWYVSEEKLEPRLGERFQEPGADREQPLAFGRDVAALYIDLVKADPSTLVAGFLLVNPLHRHAVRRVQLAGQFPYCEIRDNLIAASMVPIDLLRCKLSFFGASRFDPKSDRWVRITMYQHAPFPDELDQMAADDWIYPPLPAACE
jgi:hypothetical protein